MDNNQALSQAHCSYLQEMQQEPVADLNENYTLKTAGRG